MKAGEQPLQAPFRDGDAELCSRRAVICRKYRLSGGVVALDRPLSARAIERVNVSSGVRESLLNDCSNKETVQLKKTDER